MVFNIVGHGCSYEIDNFVEDIQKVLVPKNSFLANFHDVEDGITSCQLDFDVLIFQRFDHRRKDLVEVLTLMALIEERHGDYREAVEPLAAFLGIISFRVVALIRPCLIGVREIAKHLDYRLNLIHLVILNELLNHILQFLRCLLSLLNGSKRMVYEIV